MRRKIIALFIGILCSIVIIISINMPLSGANILSEYYILNSYDKINASNVVTAIYLYFRYYDTLFETLMLLFSITGILALSIHEGDEHDE